MYLSKQGNWRKNIVGRRKKTQNSIKIADRAKKKIRCSGFAAIFQFFDFYLHAFTFTVFEKPLGYQQSAL